MSTDQENQRRRHSIDRLIATPEVRKTLGELGVFVRNFRTGDSYPNFMWRELGYDDEQLTEEFWQQLIHPDDAEHALLQYDELLTGERSVYRVTYRIRCANGEWRWIANSGRVITWDDEGRPELFIGADVDITERRDAEEALERAKAEAVERAQEADALRMAGAIVASTLEVERTVQLVLDQALNVVPYDTAAVQLLRDGALEVIGGNGWEDLDAIRGVRYPYPGQNPHSRAIETRNVVVIGDVAKEYPSFSNLSGTGIRSWLGIPLIVHGEVIGLLALDSASPDFFTPKHVRLATALGDHVAVALHNARLYEQTRELAMTDSLTGVATRRSFFVQAEHALAVAGRTSQPVSVIMADLDHFKEINDRYGHGRGDDAIRLVASAAREILRRSDIIGRYGGEEFAVVLPDTGGDSALFTAERLRKRVSEIEVPGVAAQLTVSIGVVVEIGRHELTVDGVLDRADRALYAAKRGGRNRVEMFVEE